MLRVLIFIVSLGARAIRAICRRRAELVIENLALRQQVVALKKERPRPQLDDTDRAFWVALRTSWPAWASRLVMVNSDTVARWHRERFRRYWAKISRRRHPGRPPRRRGDSSANKVDGARRLGRAVNPRRAHEPRIHHLRNDGVALLAAPPSRAGPDRAKDRFLTQPRGRHRSDGPVHRTDGFATAAIRFLRHRAQPSAHRSLQRNVSPERRLGY